ncbi:C-GCAxxG-C-C family protein [Candidatus Soleaferrea massiliensis]|uniref:C-GCAxxG-C-C family protein n=1 Tax=Candidatus Soleaferrea massiliensis TaxID=1470354 RepID=UPI00058EC98C|nr:C-GCAxxG-C-C family protein [Candidatus Soleaferrea massiliensis]
MNHEERAYELFKRGYNCAQAVCCAFSDLIGVEEETLLKLSASFGGGFGRLREMCGAVAGMGFVLGALYSSPDPADTTAKAAHYARVQELADTFRQEHGTIVCRELLEQMALRPDTSPQPDKRDERYYKVRPCVRLVESAARMLDAYIEQHPSVNG